MNKLNQFGRNESGATAIEYALIAALIGVALVAALGVLEDNVSNSFKKTGDAIAAT